MKGGSLSAVTFARTGFSATVPLTFLLLCAFEPLLDDLGVIDKRGRSWSSQTFPSSRSRSVADSAALVDSCFEGAH
jgi:hypothetical protein